MEKSRKFLRSLVMYGAVGSAFGAAMTMIYEPQNLLIAEKLDWNFVKFAAQMALTLN